MGKFGKLFSSFTAFEVSCIIAILCMAVTLGFTAISMSPDIVSAIILALLIVMMIAFGKHKTKLMHTVTGSLLAVYIFSDLIKLVSLVAIIIITQIDLASSFYVVLVTVETALFVILFFNHLNIISKHSPSKASVALNQTCVTALLVIQIVSIVFFSGVVSWDNMLFNLTGILASVGKIFIFFVVVCIESKLNAYKAVRMQSIEDGSWTDEKKEETKKQVFGA